MVSANVRAKGQRARAGRKPGNGPFYAAVDLGTNNCRLLIARRTRGGFQIVDSHAQIARLGEGLAQTGRLSDAAIERAMDALSAIRAKLKARGVRHTRCIATEACRKAENGPEFIARVQKELGLTLKIIGPQEEARLAMLGCHDLIDPAARDVMVLDIGGGSTEISLLDPAAIQAASDLVALTRARGAIRRWTSVPLGVVTLSEAFSHLDETHAYAKMLSHARETLNGWQHVEVARQAMHADGAHIIGTSGTVTCLAGVHLNLNRYKRRAVDGAWLQRTDADAAIRRLRELGPEGRARLPTIGPERAGLMLSGCAIVEAAWDLFPAPRMRVADRGLREGLLMTMMYGPKPTRRRRGGRRRRSAAQPDNGAADGRG